MYNIAGAYTTHFKLSQVFQTPNLHFHSLVDNLTEIHNVDFYLCVIP